MSRPPHGWTRAVVGAPLVAGAVLLVVALVRLGVPTGLLGDAPARVRPAPTPSA